jgi:polyhydroxyalkanoate synthesis regulator phasin
VPQPKKSGSTARKPAAEKPAAAKPTAAAKRSTRTAAKAAPKRSTRTAPKATARKAAAARPPAAAPPSASNTLSAEDVSAHLGALRERLISSLTLTTERLQDAVDDAVRRGRMTRKDAEDLLSTLVSAGRTQTEALLADLEQLLGRGSAVRVRAGTQDAGDAVLRTVDRARRRVGVGSFPILGYDDLTAPQITKRLVGLTPAQLRKVRDYERRNGKRKSVLVAIERKLG